MPDDDTSEYDRLFDTLVVIADRLDLPADEADELINDVLISTLVKHDIPDIDVWVTAAFTSAVNDRRGRAS